MARGRKRGLIDLHVPSSPPTDTCIPQNNHSTSNTISFLAVSDLLRLFPAVSGHILTFSRALEQSDAGVTAEYGPARAQKNQTGKWYPQIPVDHTTLQINQRVVNTTLIPVKLEHCRRLLLGPLVLRRCGLERPLRGERAAAARAFPAWEWTVSYTHLTLPTILLV